LVRLRLRTVALLRPRSLACRARVAPCVLALLGSRPPRTSRRCGINHQLGESDGRGRRTSLPSRGTAPRSVHRPHPVSIRIEVCASSVPTLGGACAMVTIAGGSPRGIHTRTLISPVWTPHNRAEPGFGSRAVSAETSGFACSPRGEFAFVDPCPHDRHPRAARRRPDGAIFVTRLR